MLKMNHLVHKIWNYTFIMFIFVSNKTHHASNPDFYRGSAPGWVFDFYKGDMS